MKIPETLTTKDTAAACRTTVNALLTSHSKRGHWQGIRPFLVGRRLLWPADQVTRLLSGDGAKLRAEAEHDRIQVAAAQARAGAVIAESADAAQAA
jgi:hypothetical protein